MLSYILYILLLCLAFITWILLTLVNFSLFRQYQDSRALLPTIGLFFLLWFVATTNMKFGNLIELCFYTFILLLTAYLFTCTSFYQTKKRKINQQFTSNVTQFGTSVLSRVASGTKLKKTTTIFTPTEELELKRALQDHMRNPNLTISLLAAELSTNKTYLSRYFNLQLGTSFPEYVTSCRLIEAEKLLLEKNTTILEISEHVGFQTLSTFYQAFNTRHQMTPSQWRSRAKEGEVIPLKTNT